ncbi:MAG TPA: DMT family transporter [Candidatus Nanopelagicaceae bacterium]|nr:DMT family transporter [Candidatus Nanopelagicaceae bacterium]
MSGRRRALLILAGANCLWAGSYVTGKAALATWPFASVNMLRFTIAAAVLFPYLWRRRHLLPRGRGDQLRLAAMCALGFIGNKAFEYWGLSLSTATDMALLIAAEALVTVLLSILFLGERIRRWETAGLLVGGFGVYLVVVGGLRWPGGFGGGQALGNLLILVSLVLEAAFTVVGKTVVSRYPPFLVTAAIVTGSLVAWWPAGLAALAVRGWPQITWGVVVGGLYLGLVTTVIGYWAWFYGLQRVMPGAMAPLLFIQPLVGTALAVLIRSERPGLATLVGGGLVLAGVSLVVSQRHPAEAAPVAGAGSA